MNEFAALMGTQTAETMQAVIKGASDPRTNAFASALGIGAALITVTGVFGEVQASLNAIWKVTSNRSVPTRLMRARLASLGLVVTSGFLLSVSLVVSAALAAASIYLKAFFPREITSPTYGTAGAGRAAGVDLTGSTAPVARPGRST